jgi:hypothetical protein
MGKSQARKDYSFKSIMVRIFVLVTVLFQFQNVHAQIFTTCGAEAGIPINFANASKIAYGWQVEHGYKFSEKIAARLSEGYSHFKGKLFGDSFIGLLAFRAGGQWFPAEKFFVYGDAGVGWLYDYGTKHTDFTYGLGAGYRIPVTAKDQFIQFSVSYNNFRLNQDLNYSWFGVKVAYGASFDVKH